MELPPVQVPQASAAEQEHEENPTGPPEVGTGVHHGYAAAETFRRRAVWEREV